jgi:Rrf2 family protein
VRISAKTDYALRALVLLGSRAGATVSSEELATAQAIPHKFLEAILVELRRTGLITSQRGAAGGHRLSLPPQEISVADVIRALSGPLTSVRGECPEDLDYEPPAESLRVVWVALRAAQRSVLETVSLADLMTSRMPRSVQELADSADAWVTHCWTNPLAPADPARHAPEVTP